MVYVKLGKEYNSDKFAIDGVAVCPPSIGKPIGELNTTSTSYRNMNGDFVQKLKSINRKFNWEYNEIPADDWAVILSMIHAKQSNGVNTFSITSWSAKDNAYVTVDCYPSPTLAQTVIAKDNGKPTKYSAKINWIEIKGGLTGK